MGQDVTAQIKLECLKLAFQYTHNIKDAIDEAKKLFALVGVQGLPSKHSGIIENVLNSSAVFDYHPQTTLPSLE